MYTKIYKIWEANIIIHLFSSYWNPQVFGEIFLETERIFDIQ